MIRGSDNKCSDMVVDYFQYHRICMNNTCSFTGEGMPYTSTNTSPCDAAMTQLISCLDESLFRDGAIFFVTVLRNEFRQSLETHGGDNVKSN